MKPTDLFRFATLFLCLSVVPLSAADTENKNTPPPTTEIKTWHFEADIDSRAEVTLFRGEEIDHVISKMGEPRRRSKIKKKDPTKQELGYIRKIQGPMEQKQVTTRDSTYTLRYRVTFTDEITLIFKEGRLLNVSVYRTRSDNQQDSLPPFMR